MSLALCVLNATAYGQLSTQDSCICYTDAQDIRCLECLINADKRLAQVENLQDQISLNLAEIELLNQLVAEQKIVINDLQANLADSERKRERLKKWLTGAFLLIAGETVILLIN